jgi:molybdate transport system ATP-binding protein
MTAGIDAALVVRRSDGFVLDASLQVERGDTHALVGPNGAGKSTLVSAIAGLLAIDEGSITLNGAMCDDPRTGLFRPPQDRSVSVMFQDGVLFPHLTVFQNVAFGLVSREVPKSEVQLRASEWIANVGLNGIEDRRPSELSGGERQRVALARALVLEPDVLILDEPLSALDVTARGSMRGLIRQRLAAFDGAAIVITHDPMEAMLLGDVVHVLEDGAIVQSGTPSDIRLKPASRYSADIAGVNLVSGIAHEGRVSVDGHELRIADGEITGPVLVSFHPRTVTIHADCPHGSARNTWQTTIESIESHGRTVRLQVGTPMALTAEITASAMASLELSERSTVYVSIKATELSVQPSSPSGG